MSEIAFVSGGATLGATLTLPDEAHGLVVFAHGSGSSRFSPRNRQVADALHAAGFGTLLADLLTQEEERVDDVTREHRFDIALLGERVVAAIDHVTELELRIGTFGASTGAAAALIAAAERPALVQAVVSRGGRPDLADAALGRVQAPTLLIVGERDPIVLDLNREAMAQMTAPVELEIVPRATHLFEEPGALDEVARLAREWFARYLAGTSASSAARSEAT
jgi:putative phosphoribosyl transferase